MMIPCAVPCLEMYTSRGMLDQSLAKQIYAVVYSDIEREDRGL